MAESDANIFPVLCYRDAPAAIEFLASAFGFEHLRTIHSDDGLVQHAELRFGPGVVMVGSRSERSKKEDVSVYVEDVDTHFERAKAAGAEIIREPEDTEYGARIYAARDSEGHTWVFGTYRPELGD